MQAVTFSEFGGPEVLQIVENAVRRPEPGEVTIDVAAASINPTDIMMRSGAQAKTMTDLLPPYIAGMEFSGRVAGIGQGVGLRVGQPVIGVVNSRRPDGGAQAQQICVPAAWVAAINDEIHLMAAAAVPMNSLTAVLALEMLDLSPGQTLLVTGGTGIMGRLCHPACASCRVDRCCEWLGDRPLIADGTGCRHHIAARCRGPGPGAADRVPSGCGRDDRRRFDRCKTIPFGSRWRWSSGAASIPSDRGCAPSDLRRLGREGHFGGRTGQTNHQDGRAGRALS